jgi:hypothetical protein
MYTTDSIAAPINGYPHRHMQCCLASDTEQGGQPHETARASTPTAPMSSRPGSPTRPLITTTGDAPGRRADTIKIKRNGQVLVPVSR